MIIAIDARELEIRPTGVGRYLTHLLTAWNTLEAARHHRFVLYVPGSEGAQPPALPPLPALDVRVRALPGGVGTWWEQVKLAAAVRQDRPDVLFSPAYTAPLATRVPTVVTVHDVSFLAHPEWFPPAMRLRRRVLTTLAGRRARTILTVSAFSAREVVAHLGVPAARVRVIPLALPTPLAGTGRHAGRPPSASPEPMVLFVGSIFNRRHVPELIRAVARLSRPVRLEIVGDNRTYPHQDLEAVAAAEGLAGRMRLHSYVTDAVLAGLYARASAFAFVSDYEGFGLTPLEALAAGVPIVVGDTPVAHEVYGDAASFVPPGDIDALSRALEGVLFEAGVGDTLAARAPAVLSRYSWDRVGRETLRALEEGGDGRG